MLINEVKINGQMLDICERVANEFAEAIKAYDFKDFDEFNMVMQWQDRCSRKNYFDWCPEDTKNLKNYLGMV